MKRVAIAWFLLQSDPQPTRCAMSVSSYDVQEFNIANDGIIINVRAPANTRPITVTARVTRTCSSSRGGMMLESMRKRCENTAAVLTSIPTSSSQYRPFLRQNAELHAAGGRTARIFLV
jgi:hypothetical protein